MAEPLAFINSQSQTYESLKAQLGLTGISKSKFDALNSHIANTVVLAGELVIIGDASTSSSTSQEAYLMAKARDIHIGLLTNHVDADDFFLDNFELLQGMLANGAIGAGVVSDAWSKHMATIKKTLEEIEQLHKEYLRSGSITARDKFYSERAVLFGKLELQLANVASYGSGLRYQGSIKRMLGISTKRYMSSGEIAGYAEKVSGVARAAKLIKNGTYIGTALDVASTALDIQKACSLGREDECRKAKYVESAALVGGLTGGAIGGSIGGSAATGGCIVVLGIASGGPGALVCGVLGGAVGGWVGGNYLGDAGERMGEYLYGKMTQ
ncbi:SSU ribosomal protein S2p (SAe) [Pseudomonas sp. RIT-PI-q]|uniref:hypothetical protein n=1 Tax=Pseudomonas sp. RIT-PI-q TaxID=1690247 RepID=UPI0006CCBCAD|nr:hypothetical protein [Pseudomonas sp. RIT-PI-q]KPG95527.1 SSU ribosomal protein S2p (SAe) [Pseudomonas sp. RIT-PI-q]